MQHALDNAQSRVPAGLLRRLGAIAYDGLLLGGVLFVVTLVVLMLRGGQAVEPRTPWFTALVLLVTQLFFGGFWTHGGQTLGMRAWRLRIVAEAGGAPGWRQAIIRFWTAWLSAAPIGLGFWWSLWDPERRTWHDRLSSTALVHEPDRRQSGTLSEP